MLKEKEKTRKRVILGGVFARGNGANFKLTETRAGSVTCSLRLALLLLYKTHFDQFAYAYAMVGILKELSSGDGHT